MIQVNIMQLIFLWKMKLLLKLNVQMFCTLSIPHKLFPT